MASSTLQRVPAPVIFMVSGITQYIGAAVAVHLIGTIAPTSVAWARVAVAAVVLLAWRRPWRHRWPRRDLLRAAGFGVVLAGMNVAFYEAIAVLPLGTAVGIEFFGPVAVAAITGRTVRERAAIAVALPGVLLLAGVSLDLGPSAGHGLLFIAIAAVAWAGYIVLGRRVAVAATDGTDALAIGMLAGAVVWSPLAPGAVTAMTSLGLVLAIVAVGVLSSVVPYALEQQVLTRVTAATFAVLLAMLPATAALVGAVALRQWPSPLELVGLVFVSVAIALTGRGGSRGDVEVVAP